MTDITIATIIVIIISSAVASYLRVDTKEFQPKGDTYISTCQLTLYILNVCNGKIGKENIFVEE